MVAGFNGDDSRTANEYHASNCNRMEGGVWRQNQVLGGSIDQRSGSTSVEISQAVSNFLSTAKSYSGYGKPYQNSLGMES